MIKRRKKLMAEVLVLAMCTSLVPTTIAFAVDTINQASAVNGTTVSLSASNLTCEIGDHKVLIATVSGGSTTSSAVTTTSSAVTTTSSAVSVTWSSNDNNVATVDKDGNVNAVGVGSATITCIAANGSGASATCNVTVTKGKQTTISITNLSLNPSSLNLNVGDSKTITATIEPSNATNKKFNMVNK